MKQNRRNVLKGVAMAGAAIGMGAVLGGCGKKQVAQSEVIKGKSKKQEILYRGDTNAWRAYFAVAK